MDNELAKLRDEFRCPESVSGHDMDARGLCYWCRKKVGAPAPKPTMLSTPDKPYRSELSMAYGYFYDPDFGSGKYDYY